MPSSTPPCCTPDELGRFAGRHAEDERRRTARGSGPARCRPASRRRRRSVKRRASAARPRPGAAPRGTARWRASRWRCRATAAPLDAPDGEQRERGRRTPATPAATATRRDGENGSSRWPADAGGDDEAGDHHQPDDGGGRGARRSVRRAWRAAPAARCRRRRRRAPISRKASDGERDPGQGVGWPSRRWRARRRRPPSAERRHAADDPGRAPAADVRAVAEPRAQHLHGVVQGHQRARQHRRQRQLDHHDPVQGRGGQHHDRAERRLHQARAGRCRASRAGAPVMADRRGRARRKAVTSMPST